MEAKELRIGNLGQDQNGNILRCHGATTDGVSWYVIDRNKFPLDKGWKNEAIPLTEDWLLKFGFEERNKRFYFGCLDITFMFDCFFWDCTDITDWPELKHVHQLQNLYFALTGQELEIKK